MNEGEGGFNPEWDFLEDSEIKHIQNCLDSSLEGNFRDAKSFHEREQRFLTEFETFFLNALKKARSDRVYLVRLIKFIRKNLKILDLGGLSVGRSSQSNILSDANKKIINFVGEEEYHKIVNELHE
jgi:hypothetical protein